MDNTVQKESPPIILDQLKGRVLLNKQFLHLTVNENQLSDTARSLGQSKLSERYFFGAGDQTGIVDFTSFTFVGMPEVAALEKTAKLALCSMAHAAVAHLNSFSGLHAMMNTLLAVTKPNDTVITLHPDDGGHSATKGIIESIGRKHAFAVFDRKNLDFNITETKDVFTMTGAQTLYIDISVHLNAINIKALRKALGPQITIIFDVSHSLGLILGQSFQSPLEEGADIMCGNTHKTFAGPQRGVILFKNEEQGNSACFKIDTTFVSSIHIGELLPLLVTILEYQQFGEAYANQVIQNSRALAAALTNLGHEVRHSNTQEVTNNEQVHAFIDTLGDRVDLYRNLVNNNISTNFMSVLGGRPFARIGTQEISRRGMHEDDMLLVAEVYDHALRGSNVKEKVIKLNEQFPSIHYSFDFN